MISIRRVGVALSTIGMVIAAAGCGRARPATTTAAERAAAACVVARQTGPTPIVARDDHFDPRCVVARAGSTVRLVVRNAGHHPHNLTLADSADTHVAVDAGQVAFLTARVGAVDVPFSCTIHRGMRGVFHVAE